MAWIILWANGEELNRLELTGPTMVGRSSECDVVVRDLMMSRIHCRLEPLGRGWRVVDLGSKNGTRVGWQKVQTHILRDGDWLRMGRTRISFYAGEFEPAPAGSKTPAAARLVRPADPHEALSGTVSDFVLLDDEDHPLVEDLGLPSPQPRPLEPDSYCEPGVESLLNELASSLADGGTATLAAPRTRARPLPRVLKKPVYREIPQVDPGEADLLLQADASHLPAAIRVEPVPTEPRRWIAAAGITLATVAGTAIVLMSAWLLTLAP